MAQIILDSNNNLIQGDFDNATLNNRTKLQTTTTNATTNVYVVPNGSSTSAGVSVANNSNLTNASKIVMATNGTTDTQIISGVNGSGTYLPLSFYTNNALAAQISTAGVFSATGGIAASSMPSGSVIQVVYLTTTTQATYTRGQTMTPLTTSITPSSASSRIIVILTIGLGQDTSADIGINVLRNGTDIQTGSGASNTNSTFVPTMGYSTGNFNQQTLTLLDSPATTSAVTYSFVNYVNGVRTAYLNRRGADTTYACSSSVVLMEIK